MGPNSITFRKHPAGSRGMVMSHFAHQEKRRLYTLRAENIQDLVGISGRRTIIESQHNLLFFERQSERMSHGSYLWKLRRVDGEDTASSEGIRIVRTIFRLCDCGGRGNSTEKCEEDGWCFAHVGLSRPSGSSNISIRFGMSAA